MGGTTTETESLIPGGVVTGAFRPECSASVLSARAIASRSLTSIATVDLGTNTKA